ncbi:MAG: hypothetical protein HOD43_14415 [Candidatus Marinimicrobia bacterium]|jgi:curli biogenesis system outer membrane secretion channel CsgG|nr:hypothetical protein [Candidatus Neomarinimicrobiota bacterium]MBT4130238.1 hypothetical protein [Candidatus Neomarinimicrobiota bacterium]MBT4296989.1 hypothetical protein [Candidatus Neomarinimicrobiota bacterium]MBT4420613.1 hypothetical protein [Candidatus Neomarinimicrobiota bacterium]MBT4993665.1 hypothetical protein [Candidatus Neomarinimicrobiota bacterium]
MGQIIYRLGVLVLLLSLNSCTYFSEFAKLERGARDAYGRADYDAAVLMLSRSLQISQDYDKSQILMADAFLMANRVHENRIAELESSSDDFRFDGLTREYRSLVNLHDTVKNLPPVRHPKTGLLLELEIIDYSSQLLEARQMAAESHYVAGTELSTSTDLSQQKAAAKQYKKALSFVAEYKDAEARYQSTRKAGVKRVAVFPFEDLSGKNKSYGAVEQLVVDEMVTSVMRDPSATEFLELISRDQLDRVIAEQKLGLSGLVNDETAIEVGALLGVHEILTGKITQIIYTPVQTIHREYKEAKRVVVKTEKYKDKEGKTKTRKVYADVEAKVKHYTRSTKAVIKGSYKIVDVRTSKVIRSESFEGKSSFSTEWAVVKGDTRALKSHTAKLARKGETVAPVGGEMVSQAATDLANSLSNSLKIYAR